MREERLLERLQSWKKDPGRRSREDPRRTVDSVLAHLQRVLNTRQGNVPIADDYGVPDFTSFLEQYPDSLRSFEQSVRETIEKYEPRLKAVRVRFTPDEHDPQLIRFQILGKLASSDQSDPVHFESTVGPDGKIRIRR